MNINISAPINNTGYGIASYNIIKELSKNNTIGYFPIGNTLFQSDEDKEFLSNIYKNGLYLDASAPFLKIWHQFDLSQRIGKGKYYALSFFELDTFNNQELIHLNIPDVLFVTSDWGKSILEKHNIKTPIEVIPLGVDRNIFNENLNSKTDNKYIFLNIGKWEVRKGHDILLELFLKAFPNETDVELWICAAENTNSYSSSEELQRWKSMYNHPRIRVIPGVETQEDLAKLIGLSDCGIYPTRAEGWNLELLETMSMNKPIITTNYSSQTQFCNKDNSFLVEINNLERAFDNKAFKNQGNWAKIGYQQKDQFIELMRFVYKNKINTNTEGIKTAKTFSWTNTANLIDRCIGE